MGRIKKNISFSEHEKEIFDYLTKCGNASALIKKLVYKHMILTGYLDDAIVSEKEKLKKNNQKETSEPDEPVDKTDKTDESDKPDKTENQEENDAQAENKRLKRLLEEMQKALDAKNNLEKEKEKEEARKKEDMERKIAQSLSL